MLLAGKRLNGQQKEDFRKALHAAFDYNALEQMLSDHLDKRVTDIIMPWNISFPDILKAIIDEAERESWTAQLLHAVLSKRPEDAQLIAFAQQFGSVVITPPLKELVSQYPGFERAITPAPMHDYDRFLQGLWERGSQVCRIEANGKHMGTGFLVGPDRVMTCYHVWKAFLSPGEFECYFDHKSASEGPYRLAQDYEVDVSKYNPDEGLPNGRVSTPDELDYAILRLDGEPGKELILRPFQEKPSLRGWMTPYAQEYAFPPDSPLYILHYPQLPSPDDPQKPFPLTLKLSLEEHAIIENDGMRVRYSTNTQGGSSGSPCFSANWELVAMHHFGDRNNPPQYNQGIPFAAIKRRVGLRYKSIFIPFFAQTFSGTNNTNGHEASENTQPVSDSHAQNQTSPSSKKLPPSTSQEPAVSTLPNTASIDRKFLLKLLENCPSGVFSKIIYLCQPPSGALSSDQASQTIRAIELLKWAEGDGGIGLSSVHDYYREAMGIEKKTPRTPL